MPGRISGSDTQWLLGVVSSMASCGKFLGSDLCALLHLRFLTSASLGPLRAQMRSGEIVWHLMQQGCAVVFKTEERLLRRVWEQTVFGHSWGIVICFRQKMPSGGEFTCLILMDSAAAFWLKAIRSALEQIMKLTRRVAMNPWRKVPWVSIKQTSEVCTVYIEIQIGYMIDTW